MSGGNLRAGVSKKRLVNQVYLTRIETGTGGVGSVESPYLLNMRVGNWYENMYVWVCPWPASLVGLTASGQIHYRVEQGSLQVELAFMEKDGTWLDWTWGPGDCVVTPDRMAGVADWQWDAWTFERGVYVLPAKSALRVRLSLVDCVVGDGSLCRWQSCVVLEPEV